MKKILFLMLTAVAAVALMVSCKPEKTKGEGGKTEKTYRLVKYVDAWSGSFDYHYGTDGKISTIDRVEEWGNSTYRFDYKDDQKLDIYEEYMESGELKSSLKYAVVLNAKGFATKFGSKTITYNDKGQMTKVEEDGNVISEATWDANGNLTKWTRKDGDSFKNKLHSYGTDKNVGKIHNIFVEDCGIPRWLAEIGLAGVATEYLCTGNGWEDPSNSSYEYEANDDGYVTKETKIYGEDKEIGIYTWEEVK